MSLPHDPVDAGRIDVHAHYLTNRYRREVIEAGHGKPDGMPALPQWSASQALEVMDENGIATAMLSISSPGVYFGNPAKARLLARSVNDEGAQLVHDHPGRFGLFASLPLPDLDGALHEIEYALDVLKADGIVIETNQHGIYPGDARLDPIFAELDRRHAVLFIHPTSPQCTCCQPLTLGYPAPMIEFMFETSRAVANMMIQGTFDKFPNIRFIIPHAGATLPLLLERIVGFSGLLGEPLDAEGVAAIVQRLHFDLAGFPVPHQLRALLEIANPDRLLYGSDWPFTPRDAVHKLAARLDRTPLLGAGLREKVMRGNGVALFPRLAR